MSQSIQIYSGTGANNTYVQGWKQELKDNIDGRLYRIDEFYSSYTAGLDRGSVALVILPDGNTREMFEPLMHLADKVKQTVNNRSAFLGSCAGASYAATPCNDFFKFHPIPMYSQTKSIEERPSIVEVNFLPSRGHYKTDACLLNQDPAKSFRFESIYPKDLFDCRVLAEYKHERDSKAHISAAAILYQPFGAIPRLLTGIHPEIALSNDKDNELLRKAMCRSWFAELGLTLQG